MWLLTFLPLTGPLVALLLGLPVLEVYGNATARARLQPNRAASPAQMRCADSRPQ